MTRMIERWFPCQEVTDNSARGWGSGNSEVMLFSWFAKRPLSQARAAVLTSLLPWPDSESEQEHLRKLVRASMEDLDAVPRELRDRLPKDSSVLDPFSGRGMIPLEAARLEVEAWAMDLSPVACVASRCLASHPLRDWSREPSIPFSREDGSLPMGDRLVADVEAVLSEIHRRVIDDVGDCYPSAGGDRPWGYLWAEALPCQECGLRFPLMGSLVLRRPNKSKSDPGQSLLVTTDDKSDIATVSVVDGEPRHNATRVVPHGKSKYDAGGKAAVCPRCSHPHPKEVQLRLVGAQASPAMLLAVAYNDDRLQRVFREPSPQDREALSAASLRLASLEPLDTGLSAIPDERIPDGNTWTMQGQAYGARTFTDLSIPRQNLLFAATTAAIRSTCCDLLAAGISEGYAYCLTDYALSVLARRLKFSTRGARLRTPAGGVNVSDVFGNSESSWSYQYDFLETGLSDGPGTWQSLARDTCSVLRRQLSRRGGTPASVMQGSATSLPFPDGRFSAVVTDPPYDSMIEYADASDLYFVWMKRALAGVRDDFLLMADAHGLQDKAAELIVKKGSPAGDHRTRTHYDSGLTAAFREARRKVRPDGVVTVVFGHGDPDVWHRLLSAVSAAGLVLTGSWPARTEKKTGGSNIETTLTLACRPAATDRPTARVADVDAEVKREIRGRIALWDSAGLALTDQLMASAGPAMEVVGRYSAVLDKTGQPVDLDRYLPLARRYVEEAADIRIDTLPLETFDARTRFTLFWARLYGRSIAAASEARWQRLASDLTEDDTAGLLIKDGKGVRLAFAEEALQTLSGECPVVDAALSVASVGKSVAGVAETLVQVSRTEDPFVWAAMGELSRLLPDADPDGDVWTWVVRNRAAITGASRNVAAAREREEQELEKASRQTSLFGGED